VNVEIPTDRVDVIKYSEAGDDAHQTQGAVDRLKHQLSGSVFHNG
jgi:hypothetical protein